MSKTIDNTGERLSLTPPAAHDNGPPNTGERNDTLQELYAQPKESFLRRYGKRIAGGLACATFVSLVMHLTPVIEAIRWTGQIIRVVFGQPAAIKHIPTFPVIKEKTAPVVVAVKDALRDHPKSVPKVAVPLAASVAAGAAAKKLNEEVRAVKGVVKGMDKVAKSGQAVADAVNKTGDKAHDVVNNTGERIAKALHDRKEAREKAHHDQLIVRARKLRLKVDDTWPLTRLDAEVNAAEDLIWEKRYNAQCPRCHHPIRITEAGKREQFCCAFCKTIFSGRTARALGAPPRVRHGLFR
jgi:hypothetical protein